MVVERTLDAPRVRHASEPFTPHVHATDRIDLRAAGNFWLPALMNGLVSRRQVETRAIMVLCTSSN